MNVIVILTDGDPKEHDDLKYIVFDILKDLSNFKLFLSMVLARIIAISRVGCRYGKFQI